MAIKVYNTLTRQIELFKPWEEKKVDIYVCGPTVYDFSHVGHARTYIAFDVIIRYLKYRGYKVKFIVNITNVEDKIINRAKETKTDPIDLARKFENIFFADMTRLGILEADAYPKVSDHIGDIIAMVHTLVGKGIGYKVNHDIYFDVNKFRGYGKLSHQSLEGIRAGARIEVDERKRNPADFALWKSAKSGEICWESPWGMGRPGWHIECSAMANKYFGSKLDIHGGGQDLIFPHHENEIAQSESYSGVSPFVKYWLHIGLLVINGKKMSKSLGNFVSIGDLLGRYDADALRLLLISTHYRRPIAFSETNVMAAKNRLSRMHNTVDNLRERIGSPSKGTVEATGTDFQEQAHTLMGEFVDAMDNDFDTPRALTQFYQLARVGNKALLAQASVEVLNEILDSLMIMARILGILSVEGEKGELSEGAKRLLREREIARSQKEWRRADELRAKLKVMGILLEDLPEGTQWRYVEET